MSGVQVVGQLVAISIVVSPMFSEESIVVDLVLAGT